MLLCGTVDKNNLLIVSKGMNIEHRTSNVEFWIMYSAIL